MAYNTNKIYTKFVENIKSYNTPKKRKILELIQTGARFSQTGNYTEAISCYDKALTIDPTDSNVMVNKGDALTNMGRYEEATKYYDIVLSHKPNSSMAIYNKSCVMALQGKTNVALDLLEKAISFDSSFVQAAITESAFVRFRDFQRFKLIVGY